MTTVSIPGQQSDHRTGERTPWPPATRVAFRYCFAYLGLFCLWFAQITFVFTGIAGQLLGDQAIMWQMVTLEPVTSWVGRRVEDLDFADARATGRDTMGRGARGKRFRRTVSGIPTAVFRNRLAGMAAHAGIELFAVNPAYSSIWGEQHWRRPFTNVTRHQAAATVIGRRAQGHSARRRKGVTLARPADRAVRATNQTGPDGQQATTSSRHRPGTPGTTSRAPNRTRTRLPGRATVTPALANNGQLQL